MLEVATLLSDDESMPPLEELITMRGAIAELGVPYHLLRYAINTGKLASWRVGNRIQLRRADVERLRDERMRPHRES